MLKKLVKAVCFGICCLIFWGFYELANISSVLSALLVFISGGLLYFDIKYVFRQREYYRQRMGEYAQKRKEACRKRREERERERNDRFYLNNCNLNIKKLMAYVPDKENIVSISHSYFKFGIGGTEKLINDQYNILRREGYGYIHIYPIDKNATIEDNVSPEIRAKLVGLDINTQKIGFFTPQFIEEFLKNLGHFGRKIQEYHIHHLLFFQLDDILRIVEAQRTPVRFYLHDYYTVCRDFNMLRNGKQFCGYGRPGEEKCAGCTNYEKSKEFIREMRHFLERIADRTIFVAPSEAAKKVWGSAYPEYENRIEVLEHLKLEGSYTGNKDKRCFEERKIRVAYVGYQSVNKGWLEWERLCKTLEEKEKDYEFFHFGASEDQYEFITKVPVSFQAEGPNAMIDKLRAYHIDIAYLWSVWPETYSFTYFESFAANAYIVTTNLSGNIAVQTEKNKNGRIFSCIDELINYMDDYNRVKADLEAFKSSNVCGPDRLVPSEDFLNLIEK